MLKVEHTVTEEVTGVDAIQTKIRIAVSATLEDIGLRPRLCHPATLHH